MFKVAFLIFLFPATSFAATAFLSEICNMTNIVTGSFGKVVASFAVVGVGVGFFNGKVSWGLLVGVCAGVGLMFGAPTIVSAISGKSSYECVQNSTYVTTCANGECYSCPAGYGGSDCKSCAVGFTGPTCSDCITGYTGASCSDCESGYTKYQGVCHPNCSVNVTGFSDSTVDGGVGTISCDGTNFTGSASYSCLNGTFTITEDKCSCKGNFSGSNCTSCVTGYSGSDCTDCASDYTKVGSTCSQNCTPNFTGISSTSSVLPPSGTIQCNESGYSGSVDYSCVSGIFSATSGSCIYNHCSGGTESIISSNGTVYKLHVFNSGGSFSCPVTKSVEYLVVGGGGGGGARHAGGGGAGGLLSGTLSIPSGNNYTITVGSGGGQNSSGSSSSIGTLVVARGGGRGSDNGTSSSSLAGGSGGGASNFGNGGSAISGQGNNGGNAPSSCCQGIGAGGGGAGSAGSEASGRPSDGGSGISSSITGTAKYYAGGGGGGSWFQNSDPAISNYVTDKSYGIGGSGVGGNGGDAINKAGGNGADNTGSGGGGAGATNSTNGTGGSGGSGVVIIRYVY